MESSSDELPEKEDTQPMWKDDHQSASMLRAIDDYHFYEETYLSGQSESTINDNMKPLLLSEKLNRVLCLTEEHNMKMAPNESAENFASVVLPLQNYKNEDLTAPSLLTESQNTLLLSEELKNVLSFTEHSTEKMKLQTEAFENKFESVRGEKMVDIDSARALKRPVRTANRRLRSHNRSRRYQHERSTLSFSDEADVHEVHSSITRFGSITDLQRDLSIHHIKRKRSHSADSSDFPASFSDSSPQATDPSTDEELPTCATCGKCFRKKYALVKHVFTHVPNVSKPLYVCKDCGKVIPTASVLRKHRRIHLNELPASCTNNRRSVPPIRPRKYDEGPVDDRTYRCPYCFRSFNQFEYFRRHLNVHSGRHFGRHIYRLRN